MKRFVLKIILFFVLIAIADISFGMASDYMISHAKSGATKQLVDLCEKDKYDLLIMGSSKAHHNYIPQVIGDSLGMTCYNAGYDGNGIILAYGILSLIDDDRLPKVVVYDVKQQFDFCLYENDGDHTRYYKKMKIYYGDHSINEIIGKISEQELLLLNSNLYKFNGELFSMLLGLWRSSKKAENKGYEPLTGYLTDKSEQEKDYTTDIDTLEFFYFQKFIELTKTKHIKLIVVFSPEYNSPFSKDFKPIRDLCKAYNVRVIDYYVLPSFQKNEYFKDHCHLNEVGSKVFTSKIANDIKKIVDNKKIQQ